MALVMLFRPGKPDRSNSVGEFYPLPPDPSMWKPAIDRIAAVPLSAIVGIPSYLRLKSLVPVTGGKRKAGSEGDLVWEVKEMPMGALHVKVPVFARMLE